MSLSLRLSAALLAATMLTAGPAGAVSLNVGGNGGLLQLGGSNTSTTKPVVSVDSGTLLNTTGTSTNQPATVRVDTTDLLGSGGSGGSGGTVGGITGGLLNGGSTNPATV